MPKGYGQLKLKPRKTRMKSDKIIGGLSDKIPPSQFHPVEDELKMGIKVEMEHTNSKVKAAEIARDHLTEDPHYYTHLKQMEEKSKTQVSVSKISKRSQFSPKYHGKYIAWKGSKYAIAGTKESAKKAVSKL